MQHNPWRELAALDGVVVSWRDDLPPGVLGATDGVSIIYLRKDLRQVERRCTLAHELTHLRLGHRGCVDPRTEAEVRRLTALRLVSLPQLLDAARWAGTDAELARELWVTRAVLADRLAALSPAERAQLDRVADGAWHHG
ncbi:ImmA/IrrE family metallo-endopeptidase [Sediminivirga luteola]|jgi:hypothetical protein|uniref:IrrE N-terminal-like domain-containing protein n=1 Tax=Sediminivirga luteola TaxID=1774748 RepID=A0A8J2TX10_9MICO|nr:ImmA/IrrE family metallo-endopeptidase [Sediminivirga luteola]MCI2265446.1 ImmA/IrrE family metallo-endopeptidase [Sediminivirga luteola]GGA10510.1 hypothetical protein GCM10011333_11630 [Sediminivirga luteola]